MARDHARLLVSIWSDKDWTALTSRQQIVYLAMASSPDLSWCGVLPLAPGRMSDLSADMTEKRVHVDLKMLVATRFVLVDTHTAEVLVRTYIRHDGILGQPNVTKACVKALAKVHSPTISEAIKVELGRGLNAHPEAKGWAVIRSESPDLFKELQAKASRNPSMNPFRKVS